MYYGVKKDLLVFLISCIVEQICRVRILYKLTSLNRWDGKNINLVDFLHDADSKKGNQV